MNTYEYQILSEKELKTINGGGLKTAGKFILGAGEQVWDFAKGFAKGFYDTAKKF